MVILVSLLKTLLQNFERDVHLDVPTNSQQLVDVFREVCCKFIKVFVLLPKHDVKSATAERLDVVL